MIERIIVYCTVPNIEIAETIAERTVNTGVAACLSIIPGIRSIYRWKGEICRGGELLCILKTTRDRFDELEKQIRLVHPYEVPEIVAVPIIEGHQPYLSWIDIESGKK